MPIIAVDHLSKVFRINQKDPGLGGALKALVRPRHVDKVAVAGITFAVEPGEVVGYIGVNGAGKSTTIKMLTGILVPSGGQVRVFGRDIGLMAWLSPLVAAVLVVVGYRLWQVGLRRYSGTGS